MLIEREEVKLHSLIRDPIARLLFLNSLFVIIGYALANLTEGVLTAMVSNIKNLFLFFSFAFLIITRRVINPGRIFDSAFLPVIFGVLIFYVSVGTQTKSDGFFRTLTFFIPLIYVYLSLSYLILNFGIETVLKGLHWSFLIIYSIPLIIYITSGGKITNTNIYGAGTEEQAFASNNYGWSSTLYILSFLFVWKDIQLKKYAKIFFEILLMIAVILFFISANRASWLSMGVAMIPFFLTYKKLKLSFKIGALLVVLGFVAYLLTDPNSSLNYVRNKTENQEQVGESRFETAQINEDKTRWITGIGMFNFDLLKNQDVLNGYHNSYYEVLFGAGIVLFLVFLSFMVFRPLVRFVRYYFKYTLLLPPLMIIPFFESNLTGGQFLFFPWFTFMLLLNAKIKFWNLRSVRTSTKNTNIVKSDPANQ